MGRRVQDTCLCALQLMVYYRFLPTSQQVDSSAAGADILSTPVVKKGSDDVKVQVTRRKSN